jgi:hypothetical protein
VAGSGSYSQSTAGSVGSGYGNYGGSLGALWSPALSSSGSIIGDFGDLSGIGSVAGSGSSAQSSAGTYGGLGSSGSLSGTGSSSQSTAGSFEVYSPLEPTAGLGPLIQSPAGSFQVGSGSVTGSGASVSSVSG